MPYNDLVNAAALLETEFTDEGEADWIGSPFAWIREYKPATIGAIGRRLARSVFATAGVTANLSGMRLEISGDFITSKVSMEWTAGRSVFEQIKDDNSLYVFCLGLYPQSASAWLIPQQELFDGGIIQTREGLRAQHTGTTGTETAWLAIDPGNVPAWLQPFGGTIENVTHRITEVFQ